MAGAGPTLPVTNPIAHASLVPPNSASLTVQASSAASVLLRGRYGSTTTLVTLATLEAVTANRLPAGYVHPRADGLVELGTFTGETYTRYRGSPTALNAIDTVGTETLAGFALRATSFAAAASGVQAIAGAAWAGGRATPHVAAVLVYWRQSVDAAWQGPVTVCEGGGDPVLLVRSSGQWETAWLSGSGWVHYLADSPAGPWVAL
jgi:hypothetical protein